MKQSVPLSIFLSYCSGLLDVVATVAAALPEYAAKKGKKWPQLPWVNHTAISSNLLLRLVGMIALAFATIYGPVSIVTPTNQAGILVSNMIIFGLIMRAEEFSKEVILGTSIITLGAILLPVVGADLQQNQHILQNLSYPGSITLSTIFILGMVLTTAALFHPRFHEQKGTKYAFYVILAAQVVPNVLGATLTKMIAIVHGWPLCFCIIGSFYCLILLLYSALLQATYVKQNKFVPWETSLTIFLNEISGFMFWHDYLAVQSWIGYGCVMALFGLGSFLLGNLQEKTVDESDLEQGLLENVDAE